MDTEKDIEIATVKLMRDTKLPKLEVLKMILGRYQSQRRLEEAVIVRRVMERELSKPEEAGMDYTRIFDWVIEPLLAKRCCL
jgi:hypothetical protein